MTRYYLPVSIVDINNEKTNVQKAHRLPGTLVGKGSIKIGDAPSSTTIDSGKDGSSAVDAVAELLHRGLQILDAYSESPTVKFLFKAASSKANHVDVTWIKNHNAILDILSDDAPIAQMDCGWAQAFKDQDQSDSPKDKGLAVIAAIIMLRLTSALAGQSQRESLHAILDFTNILPEAERNAVSAVLQDNIIDCNNAFCLFIQGACDTTTAMELEMFDLNVFDSVRTCVLYDAGNRLEHELFKQRSDGEANGVDYAKCLGKMVSTDGVNSVTQEEVDALINCIKNLPGVNGIINSNSVELLEKTIKWRDRWVSWLEGQWRLDMPYNQTRVVRLMAEDIEDVDEKRALINEAISSTYDMEIEGSNIQRISTDARKSGMRMVAGRLSRAFGNQAHLLSVAKVLADKEGLLPYVKALHKASMGIRELQTQSTRLLHLIQQRKQTPFAQTVGALNAFEEALFEYQSKEFKNMLQEKDESSRRAIGRPDAESCGVVLDKIQNRIRELYKVAAAFRDELEKTQKDPAAYIVFLQRLHPAETVNLANANLHRDVHPGKEEDLRDLVRQGGHYTYSSPGMGRISEENGGGDTHWIIQVDDWIEAIPLFIHERVVNRTMMVGNEEVTVEVIETEVDQEAMEMFFRLHAEFWARNIEAVMDSQHVGLARRLIVQNDKALSAKAEAYRSENMDATDDDAALEVLEPLSDLHEGIAAFASLIANAYRTKIDAINCLIDTEDLPRIDIAERVIFGDAKSALAKMLSANSASAITASSRKKVSANKKTKEETQSLVQYVTLPTRPASSLHILTTESAGMTEGYVQTWIEEEMALYNVIRHEGLEDEVNQCINQFRSRVQAVARKVIDEFGMSVVIEEVMAQQRLPEPAAVMTVLISYKPVMEEAAKLAILIEQAELGKKGKINYDKAEDPKEVEDYLTKNRTKLMKAAVPKAAANNGKAFDFRLQEIQATNKKASLYELQKKTIASEVDFSEELDAMLRFDARTAILEKLDKANPEQFLMEQVSTYIRTHTALAKSIARRRVIAKHKLNQLTQHPLYYYQSAGGNKRYNLLYTPSRVNLGHRERDSVVKWRQWVGGADRWAAQAGFEFYSQINEGGVEERPALAYAEIQKTSENALCVTHFAGSNALALLCMAVLEGDAEDMADQMTLRNDRMIPPPGEGYGGYCVPKDGLFLAFVLSLGNEVKLRQIGVPERYHAGVMKLAKEVLLQQNNFGSHFEWQRWAAEKLLTYDTLKKYFDLKDDLLVFHINKIALAVENLGQPWHETTQGSKLVANLAAQWGVDKMIIRAEQVNRFMVFYKAWSIYDAIREANQNEPGCPQEKDAVIALTAEYKPVQDVRFSTGLRLFEILAQTGDHLFHSLDEEGQNLAHLMFHGFDAKTDNPIGKRTIQQVFKALRIDKPTKDDYQRLEESFQPHNPPGDIIMSSVTMSSTQDLLHYASDAKLEEIATQVQVTLSDYGLTEDQIRANATVFGGLLHKWAGIKELPLKERDELIASIGGDIHALVLQMRGPGRDYEKDIQGVDVLNTGIDFPELLEMLDNMPKVIALMLNGNPHSSLAITDGVAGRARRCLTYLDIQLFFASCEQVGRRGVYRAIGLGAHNIERLREEMHRKRERAIELYKSIAAVADAGDAQQEKAVEAALNHYQYLRESITASDEAGQALREEEKMKRYNKWKQRNYYVSQTLAKISAGLPLQRFNFGAWLAGIGGMFVIAGESKESIQARQNTWEKSLKTIAKYTDANEAAEVKDFTVEETSALLENIIRSEYIPESQRFTQQMLVESSSKACEIAAREALERRKALKVRAERARAFNDREDGFLCSFQEGVSPSFDETWNTSQKCLKAIQSNLTKIYKMDDNDKKRAGFQSKINHSFGEFIGHTRAGLNRLFIDMLPEANANDRSVKHQIIDDLALAYTGRELILENLKKLMGGYEDIGAIARLAESAQDDREKLYIIAKAIEMFYITFSLGQTLEFALQTQDEIDPALFWKNVVDFFAESINDHWYNYWPWAYSRGVGFNAIPDDERYALAVERHSWLYDYTRQLYINRTELSDYSEEDCDALLGNFSGKNKVVAIGANAPSEAEQSWRAYNQLREMSFLKTDGFEFPPVFHEFDPAIIEADKRVNVTALFPVGRTHVSRALREGPTLNRELQAKKHKGANFLITRYNEFVDVEDAQRKALLVSDAHFYISETEYATALQKHEGLNKTQIKGRIKEEKESGRLNDKGIRIAARFALDGAPAPVVAGSLIPFHGLPIYINGQSEEEGVPATIQSQIYTDVSYDKSLYPQIFTEKTGVQLPPEIDWLCNWNHGLNEESILEKICEGYPEKNFKGLRKFGYDHPIILIKGAAESGARNLKVFDVQDDHARINEVELLAAARFIFDISRGQNVVIQEAIFTNPELWASPELMESFIERQVLDWNTPVNRDVYPRSQIYGSMRIVASSSHPSKKYDTAFPISLMSLQVATNVGRGGTLEPVLESYIQKPFRKQILKGLHAEGPKLMNAMTAYVDKNGAAWEKETGKKIGQDLRGVSYGWANYLMNDYVITPVFERRGRLVDIKPIFEDGRRIGSTPILQDENGRFDGKIIDWNFILLEPNVGIGLWDRYNLREQVNEQIASKNEGRKFDWNAVGTSDRIVLRNYVLSGEAYVKANFGTKGINRENINNAE
jgi:UDP-glucose/GDP-mannose dehydrogenase family protein